MPIGDPSKAAPAMAAAPAPQAQQAPQEAPGGASKLVADVNSGMMKLVELMSRQFPEDAQKMAGLVQNFQTLVDELGAPANSSKEVPLSMATTTPEAGTADVQQVL